MLKTILTIIKWWFLFWGYLFLGGLATGIIGGVLAGLFGIEVNIGVMVCGFTAILIAEHVLRGRRKRRAAETAVREKQAADEADGQGAERQKTESMILKRCDHGHTVFFTYSNR